jgi:hypothetical protein
MGKLSGRITAARVAANDGERRIKKAEDNAWKILSEAEGIFGSIKAEAEKAMKSADSVGTAEAELIKGKIEEEFADAKRAFDVVALKSGTIEDVDDPETADQYLEEIGSQREALGFLLEKVRELAAEVAKQKEARAIEFLMTGQKIDTDTARVVLATIGGPEHVPLFLARRIQLQLEKRGCVFIQGLLQETIGRSEFEVGDLEAVLIHCLSLAQVLNDFFDRRPMLVQEVDVRFYLAAYIIETREMESKTV